jgi:hypothetical protein
MCICTYRCIRHATSDVILKAGLALWVTVTTRPLHSESRIAREDARRQSKQRSSGNPFVGADREGIECGCRYHVRIKNETVNGHPDEPKNANAYKCRDGRVQHLEILSNAVAKRRGNVLEEPLDSFSCHNKILTPRSFFDFWMLKPGLSTSLRRLFARRVGFWPCCKNVFPSHAFPQTIDVHWR